MRLEFYLKFLQNKKIGIILTRYSEWCSWYGMYRG